MSLGRHKITLELTIRARALNPSTFEREGTRAHQSGEAEWTEAAVGGSGEVMGGEESESESKSERESEREGARVCVRERGRQRIGENK